MKSNKKLIEIVFEIYQEMYANASPKADFNALHEAGETLKDAWFMNYYLPYEDQDKIMEDIMKKHRLTKREKNKVSCTVNLGASPRGCKKWKK